MVQHEFRKRITGQRKYDIVGKPCSRHWEDNEQIMGRRRQRRKRERSRLHTSMEICWYHPRRWLPDQKKGTGFLTLMHQICKFYDISQSICGWPFLVSTKIGDYVNLSCQLSLWITFPSFGELVLVGHELILVPQITSLVGSDPILFRSEICRNPELWL